MLQKKILRLTSILAITFFPKVTGEYHSYCQPISTEVSTVMPLTLCMLVSHARNRTRALRLDAANTTTRSHGIPGVGGSGSGKWDAGSGITHRFSFSLGIKIASKN